MAGVEGSRRHGSVWSRASRCQREGRGFESRWWRQPFGDRLMAGQRTLNPLAEVRPLLPEPTPPTTTGHSPPPPDCSRRAGKPYPSRCSLISIGGRGGRGARCVGRHACRLMHVGAPVDGRAPRQVLLHAARLDGAPGYGPGGWGFESLRGGHRKPLAAEPQPTLRRSDHRDRHPARAPSGGGRSTAHAECCIPSGQVVSCRVCVSTP